MSQLPRFSRARQLTASVWPGKVADDYDSLVAARFRKLAETASTGMLPFSGAGDGAIYFRDGTVVFARSTRTPGPSEPAGSGPAVPDAGPAAPDGTQSGNGAAGLAVRENPYTRLSAALAVAEPTVDATVELLVSESRFSKFRSARSPVSESGPALDVERLLAEVTRRRRILDQLSPVVTADSPVARIPQLSAPDIRVSALQWALLIRTRDGSTPRSLAWEVGRSVFGTTLEIYRLLALRLLSSAGQRGHRNGHDPQYGPATMSFVRAVSPEKGGPMPADDHATRGGSGPEA
jgi:hypothetical protein